MTRKKSALCTTNSYERERERERERAFYDIFYTASMS